MNVKTRALKILAASLPIGGMLALSACSGTDTAGEADAAAQPSASPSASASDDGVDVIRPGAPGEPELSGPTEVGDPDFNDADVAFMTMMIPHHRQALVMADLAKSRAKDPGVRRVAARIRGAQSPEVAMMSGWLEERDEPVPAPEDDRVDADHGHGDMGMLDADELAALVDARGAEFDRLFLDGMIGHHQGAVGMTEEVSADGSDQTVRDLAADMNLGQGAEINRMVEVRDAL